MKIYKKFFAIIIPVLLMLSIVVIPNLGYASWLKENIENIENKGIENETISTTTDDVMGTARKVVYAVGTGLATIMLIVIGIKYLTGSPEGKAETKKMLVPYITGVLLVYFAVSIVNALATAAAGGNLGSAINSVGNEIENDVNATMKIGENVVDIIGTSLALIMVTILGIKYMTESPEGKGEYKKTAIPYLVGAIIVFIAPKITKWIETIAGHGKKKITLDDSISNASSKIQGITTGVMGTILTAARYIGVGTAMLMIVVLAIKYMTASPEGKVEIQKTASVYIIGAIVLFAASGIVGLIQSVAGAAGGGAQPMHISLLF